MGQEISPELKQKLFEAFRQSAPAEAGVQASGLATRPAPKPAHQGPSEFEKLTQRIRQMGLLDEPTQPQLPQSLPEAPAIEPLRQEEPALFELTEGLSRLESGESVYSLLQESEIPEPPLDEELILMSQRLAAQLQQVEASLDDQALSASFSAEVAYEREQVQRVDEAAALKPVETVQSFSETAPPAGKSMKSGAPGEAEHAKTDFNATLSLEHPVTAEAPQAEPAAARIDQSVLDTTTGGNMADLSGYKDLSRAPLATGEERQEFGSPFGAMPQQEAPMPQQRPSLGGSAQSASTFSFSQETFSDAGPDVDTEFSSNVQTLIRLVNDLPDGVTKQTGAQIIRLTMEAMGISMEEVLSEAQSAQSEMLDAVRANIKKIEEFKTVIRKLESDIKFYQGKANELSEIIDLFILSNTSTTKVPSVDDLSR